MEIGGCTKSWWSSCFNPNPQKRINAQIDRQLKKDKKVYNRTQNLLLIGTSESGKSTIFKQIRILHDNEFSDKERLQMIEDIKRNIRDAIIAITRAMPTLSPPVEFELPENHARKEWLEDFAYYSAPFYENIKALWKDKGVQTAYRRSNEYHLIDCAKYFLDRVDVIKQDDYTPSKQDILRCYVSTRGIFVTHFEVDNFNFNIFDVGGHSYMRRMWVRYFSDITGVIFVVDISSYNTRTLCDDNNMRESLRFFETFCNNKKLNAYNISHILLLNKQELLAEKIRAGESKLENYFEEFRTYQLPMEANDPNESPEVIRAKYFIRDQFMNLTNKDCYFHFTCAIDTENIENVFNDCRESIQRTYQKQHKLL